MPKRIGTNEDGNGSGSLPPGMLLETTGIGLGVKTVASAGGSAAFLWYISEGTATIAEFTQERITARPLTMDAATELLFEQGSDLIME